MVKTQKSRTMRRVLVKTPGHKVNLQYRKRKPAKAICAECGKALAGVPRERPYKIHKMGKTEKRPQRPYGGQLCSRCSRLKIISRIRQ